MSVLKLIVLLLISPSLFASEHIDLSPDQIKRLDIRLANPEITHAIPLFNAPAKVIVPPTHIHIVSTTQTGLMEKIYVALGESVKQGQTLATLNSPDLLNLQLNYLQTLSELQLARTEYKRNQQLHQDGIIAAKRWHQAKAKFDILRARLDESEQLLAIAGLSKAARQQLKKRHTLSSQLHIESPVDGILLQSFVLPGERIDSLSPLFKLARLDTLWLEINIPQQAVSQIHIDDQVIIPGTQVIARVFFIARNVDPTNQTVRIRAVIQQGVEAVRPAQTVEVRLYHPITEPAFKVPASALVQYQHQPYIFVHDATGFIARPVRLLGTEDSVRIIAGKLTPQQDIAIKGATLLKTQLADQQGAE